MSVGQRGTNITKRGARGFFLTSQLAGHRRTSRMHLAHCAPPVLGLGLAKGSQKPCLGRRQLAWRRRCAWRLAVDHHLLGLHLRSRGSNSSSRVLECAPHCALVSLAAIRGKLECCRYAVFCCAYELQNARDRCERREAAGHAWFLSGRSLLSVKHAQTTDLT